MSKVDKLLEMGYSLEAIGEMDFQDMLKLFPYKLEYPRDIYGALVGQFAPGSGMDWVENLCTAGSPYEKNLGIIFDTCRAISRRLDSPDDYDRDLRNVMNAYEDNERIIAYEMFRCGMQYQKMLEEGKI